MKKKRSGDSASVSSGISARFSARRFELIIEKLKSLQNRSSTMKNYLCIWRQFNSFVMRLDLVPKFWEDRAQLFIAQLVEDKKVQSGTVRSYVSAIKRMLVDDGYPWDDKRILLSSITRACKVLNDRVKPRLPISSTLLDFMLFELERIFRKGNQDYLEKLFKAMILLGYYGMMRVGELADGPHSLKAKDIFMAMNKEKLLLILHTSKTHDRSSRPQKIKITSNRCAKAAFRNKNFCPFKVLNEFKLIRGDYSDDNEHFFVYRDGSAVKPATLRTVMRSTIKALGLND